MMESAPRDELSKKFCDILLRDYPHHEPGTRPVHAIGIGANGYFVPSDIAPNFCAAEHFRRTVDVTVRFSNGSGEPPERDREQDVRGMATQFHLSNGVETDLIMINLPVFFADTPEAFYQFAKAGIPRKVAPDSWWQNVLDRLQFRQPDPLIGNRRESGNLGILRYANRHLAARAGTIAAQMLITPTSYVRAMYHALHTFKLTNQAGKAHYGRFTWEPVAGVRPVATPEMNDDFLTTRLGSQLHPEQPARFVLRFALASQGDDLADPTKQWDTTRQRIVMGELFLTKLVRDQRSECEEMCFNPTRLVQGIECSDDPVLALRGDVYAYSCTQRKHIGCPVGIHP